LESNGRKKPRAKPRNCLRPRTKTHALVFSEPGWRFGHNEKVDLDQRAVAFATTRRVYHTKWHEDQFTHTYTHITHRAHRTENKQRGKNLEANLAAFQQRKLVVVVVGVESY